MKKLIVIFSLLACGFSSQSYSQNILAFPTAEGFGKYASGGRGGKVVFVDNLEDYGSTEAEIPGSFRWALKQYPGEPLTILFRVSGTITIKSEPDHARGRNNNDIRCSRANLTIAGQSAPGEGIAFRAGKLNFGGSQNLIIRNIRNRIGLTDEQNRETYYGAAIGIENGKNWIIDHCCFGWSAEENMTIYDNQFTTVQNCIVHEGLYEGGHAKGNRSYGAQWGGQSATFYHNLLAHNKARSPRFNGSRGDNDVRVFIEYSNNVNYNWGNRNACYGSDLATGTKRYNLTNFMGNYYKPGPATNSTRWFTEISDGGNKVVPAKFYFNDNVMEGSTSATNNPWSAVNIRTDNGSPFTEVDIRSDKLLYDIGINDVPRFDYDEYRVKNLKSADKAYEDVLATAGTVNRDIIEKRIIEEVRTGTANYKGTLGVGGIIDSPWDVEGYPEYQAVEAPLDMDNDGMPDSWELANGLNPEDAEDRNKTNADGYTALEIYLCSLMGETIEHNFTPTSIHEVENDNVSVYPTIVTDFVNISSVDTDIKSVSVLSLRGYTIQSFQGNYRSIDFTGYAKGNYLISVELVNGKQKVFKVSK